MKNLSALKTAAMPRRTMNFLRVATAAADGETVTIGNEVYEWDTAAAPGAITAGRIRIDISAGQSTTQCMNALVAAINGNTKQPIAARKLGPGVAVVANAGVGGICLPCSHTMAGANNAWLQARMGDTGGQPIQLGSGPVPCQMQYRIATAMEVTLSAMEFFFPFTVGWAMVQASDMGPTGSKSGTGVIIYGDRVEVGGGFALNDCVAVFATA